jgi:Fuc2NAc and GlcNAc transferase
MSLLALQIGVFIAAVALTGLCKRFALALHLLDLPVARSAHSKPTPVGGGLSIVLLFLLVASQFFFSGLLPLGEYMSLLAAALIALIGLVDDIKRLDVHWRIPLQFLSAVWALWWLGGVPPISVGVWVVEAPWLLNMLGLLALLWLLNLYNFMDGIDGLAGTELVFVNVMSLLLVIKGDDQVLVLLAATLVASGAGFLLWNWPPAKIFMGDVGSSFIGFSLGLLALISMHHQSLTVWTWVILLAVFVADATTTLVRRYLAGAKWYEGHASHAYQKAARQYKSHGKVTITVIMINCLWLAPLAWLSARQQAWGFYLCLVALAPLIALAFRLGAGQDEVKLVASGD